MTKAEAFKLAHKVAKAFGQGLSYAKAFRCALRAVYKQHGAAIAAAAEKAKRVVKPTDSLLQLVARLGGLERTEAGRQGVDSPDFRRCLGGLAIFPRVGGLSFDGMAEALSQFGVFGAEDYSANGLLDKLDDALRG